MVSPRPALPRLKFGAFLVDPASGRLFKGGTPIKLPPQPFKVLLLLLENSGEVVSREEIQQQLWGSSTFVDFERGINFSINQIRGALCDNPQKPRYIETLPRVGYRFVATVKRDVSDGIFSSSHQQIAEEQASSLEATSGDAPPVESTIPEAGGSVPDAKGTHLYFSFTALALILVLASIGWQHWRRRPGLAHRDLIVTSITDNGGVSGVAISRDGQFVAYSAGNTDNESVYLRELAIGKDVQVVPQGPGFHGITFSPDGKSLYLVRADEKDVFFKYLYVVPTQGGPVRKLISDVDSAVAFSPDGHEFAYEHCLVPGDAVEVKIANVDGTGDRLLARIPDSNCFMYQPGLDWSSDGRTIAVAGQLTGKEATWVLHTVSASNGAVRRLYSSARPIGRPVWAANGSALFIPHPDKNSQHLQLWSVAFPSGEARQISHDLSDYGYSLAATADRSVFAATTENLSSNVWTAPAGDLSKVTELPLNDAPVVEVAEARDGKILTIGTDGAPWLMLGDGSQRTRFTQLRRTNFPTPCGRYVVFLSTDTDIHALVRVNADGTHPMTLATGSIWGPVCAESVAGLYYLTTNTPQKVWRVPLESGTPVEIAAIEEDFAESLAVSPDGTLLAYTYSQFGRVPSDGLHVAIGTLPGFARRQVIDVAGISDLHWSPDGGTLEYLLSAHGATNIWELPLNGGKPKQLTQFTSEDISSFHWSVDGSRLFIVRGKTKSDVVLIREME